MKMGAVLSDDGKYRYSLWRMWDVLKPKVLFVMLNPSTANAETDDPTISWCIDHARAQGFGALSVGNLYALRSPVPAMLAADREPIGPKNDATLHQLKEESAAVILGWGNGCTLVDGTDARAREVASMMKPAHCLGLTRAGHPMHPLAFARNGWRPRPQFFEYR